MSEWTSEPPSVQGWYWVVEPGGGTFPTPTIVWYDKHDGTVETFGCEYMLLDECPGSCMWAGPISEPEGE